MKIYGRGIAVEDIMILARLPIGMFVGPFFTGKEGDQSQGPASLALNIRKEKEAHVRDIQSEINKSS